MDHGKPPPPTGCPATCERFPDDCRACSMDCYAAGDWNLEPFDDGPEVVTGPTDDFVRWAERMGR